MCKHRLVVCKLSILFKHCELRAYGMPESVFSKQNKVRFYLLSDQYPEKTQGRYESVHGIGVVTHSVDTEK